MKTYQVTLPDEFAAFVDRAVVDGKFESVDHLVLYAVAQVEDELRRDESIDVAALREEIRIGLEQSNRGQVSPLDMAAIWKRVRDRLAAEAEAVHAGRDQNGSS
jgi:Arc/MetJ-type ribon-helix-helix transcriptional regulator